MRRVGVEQVSKRHWYALGGGSLDLLYFVNIMEDVGSTTLIIDIKQEK